MHFLGHNQLRIMSQNQPALMHKHHRRELPAHRKGLSLSRYGMLSQEHQLLLRRYQVHMLMQDPVLFLLHPAQQRSDKVFLFQPDTQNVRYVPELLERSW